ncbi:hypothetical protein AK812_SmicGene17352 [Symbiodinium microadriaticum]|uniref:Uncharacterized protein n=1 Tax=Symbiodinium microadriaticum TaxID=2951 RepID=A0A1Q9DXX4_SYMMI|nr:hypothetical protein AK812_SmicGene17352 [Symbiodinium microadriaticum]CAE7893265.1 unnamed protein product [Symbiodinium sp. KB8]
MKHSEVDSFIKNEALRSAWTIPIYAKQWAQALKDSRENPQVHNADAVLGERGLPKTIGAMGGHEDDFHRCIPYRHAGTDVSTVRDTHGHNKIVVDQSYYIEALTDVEIDPDRRFGGEEQDLRLMLQKFVNALWHWRKDVVFISMEGNNWFQHNIHNA